MAFPWSTEYYLHTCWMLSPVSSSSLPTKAADLQARTTTMPPLRGVCDLVCHSVQCWQIQVDLRWKVCGLWCLLPHSSGSQHTWDLRMFGAQQTRHCSDSTHSHLHEWWTYQLLSHRSLVRNQVHCGHWPRTMHFNQWVWIIVWGHTKSPVMYNCWAFKRM